MSLADDRLWRKSARLQRMKDKSKNLSPLFPACFLNNINAAKSLILCDSRSRTLLSPQGMGRARGQRPSWPWGVIERGQA